MANPPALSTPVAWGIIGAGQIALDKTLPALLAVPDARVVAIADRDPGRLNLAAAQAPNATLYTDYQALLADPAIQVVYIALPTSGHLPAVLAAAKAGKHVLCEKPLGNTAQEAQQMASACAAAGVRLMTAYMSRFGAIFIRARELVASGVLGRIVRIDSRFSYDAFSGYPPAMPSAWRWHDPAGGGPLLDIGIYLVFALREILGEGIAEVSARATQVLFPESAQRDSVVAWFTTTSGTPGTMTTTFTHSDTGITLQGTQGSLVLEDCFRQDPNGRLRLHAGGTTEDLVVDPARVSHFLHYQRQIEHFTQALRNGTPHRPSADEAVADLLVLDALAGSCRASGKPVVIASATTQTAAATVAGAKSS